MIKNSDNASIAVEQYHRYEVHISPLPRPNSHAGHLTAAVGRLGYGLAGLQEDIDLMVDLGMDYYRFSIAWPRIIPGEKRSG